MYKCLYATELRERDGVYLCSRSVQCSAVYFEMSFDPWQQEQG